MRHLLVIDDEPGLADGLSHALAEHFGDSVDICKAYSGEEALAILSTNPIDLVITDVRMPDISGLDLLHQIWQSQMNCRVIIITGYDEFNAIHEAVKLPNTAGFLLKNEGDKAIFDAVSNTLAVIEEEERNQLDLALAKHQNQALDTLLKERRLWHILGILPHYDEFAPFAETPLSIDIDRPVILMVIRCFSGYLSAGNLVWLEHQVSQYIGTYFETEMCMLGSTDVAWLLQERKNEPLKFPNSGQRAKALRAIMLEIQSRLANNGVEISVVLTSKWIDVCDLPGYVHALRNALQNTPVDSQRLRFIDVATDEKELLSILLENADYYVASNKYIHLAKNALLEGNEEKWDEAVRTICSLWASNLSVITKLLSILIATANDLDMPQANDEIPKLLNPAHEYALLRACGNSICRRNKQNSKRAFSNLISTVHEIIEKNLDSPTLSVASIAIVTHYNPSYLSRLYKQLTNATITETINEMRITTACSLLKDSNLKINDISKRVGYASSSYFTFFFRKRMGITPKAYRSKSSSTSL